MPDIATWLDRVAAEYAAARSYAAEMAGRLRTLRAAAESYSASMDLGRLYDPKRRVFGIGYAAGNAGTFTAHYDLLASECRLTSLNAIAKGDVPARHWSAMSRPWKHSAGSGKLLSWSGTMFEHLMPLLFARDLPTRFCSATCVSAVGRQREYGRRPKIPGESLNRRTAGSMRIESTKYRAFGVPELALNPDAGKDAVVAPDATMLALPLAPGNLWQIYSVRQEQACPVRWASTNHWIFRRRARRRSG